jgi:hypothetical protein
MLGFTILITASVSISHLCQEVEDISYFCSFIPCAILPIVSDVTFSNCSVICVFLLFFASIHIYIEYHSGCPLVRVGTPPLALPQASVPPPHPPPGTKGEVVHTRLRVRGRGSPNADDLRKSLALCLICAPIYDKQVRFEELLFQCNIGQETGNGFVHLAH